MTAEKAKAHGAFVHRIAHGPAPLILAAVLLGLFQLTTAPPFSWDEGWTLTVARNWVEAGHYGRFLAGEPISPSMAAAAPVVLPVSFSFRHFGVGAWQGRIPGVLLTALSLWLLYRLTAVLYSRTAGVAAMVLALVTPILPHLHPLLVGKQVLGEMPILCLILSGYLLFFYGLDARSISGTMGAGLLFGLAAVTKAQVAPFLALSLGVVVIVLVRQKHWRSLLQVALLLLVTATAYWLWPRILYAGLVTLSPAAQSPASTRSPTSLRELLAVTAFVPDLGMRLGTLVVTLLAGLPILVSLVYAARHHLYTSRSGLQRLALWVLAASWFAWYAFMSVGWPRYLFPAFFLSTTFLAGFLRDITKDFDGAELKRLVQRLRPTQWRHLTRSQAGVVILLFLVVPISLIGFLVTALHPDDSLFRLSDYLHAEVSPEALIETYETEIMFLGDQRFHYPPDRLHVDLVRQSWDADVTIDYDPLAAGPDYLISGPYSKFRKLYAADLLADHFRLKAQFGPYDLYRFVGASSPGNGDTPTASPGQ